MPKLPKITSLLFLCNIFGKKSFLKVYFNTLDIKVSYKVDIIIINGHDQAFSNYSKYQVCNIFTYLIKEVKNGGNFWHADKCQSSYKLLLSFLIRVARHIQNNWNRKFVIFLQYSKENCFNHFVFYCYAKHSDILKGSSHFCCYLVIHDLLSMLSL